MKLIDNEIQEAYKSGEAKQCKECGQIKLLKDFPLFSTKGAWVLDHDHKTDKFRGYICDSCNVAFGKFNDDPYTMQRSLNWLFSHG